jgi:hypothetical protein
MSILSVYHELVQYEETQGDMVDRINQLKLAEVFEPIIAGYPDRSAFNKILFFILHLYSKESKVVVPGQDYTAIKMSVAKSLGMSEQLIQSAVFLQCPLITRAVQNYLKRQMSKTLEHLVMKRELYMQMVHSAISDLKDGSGLTDYEQKAKNSAHANKLYDEIHEWETRLMDENKDLKSAMDDLRNLKVKKNTTSLRPEDLLKEINAEKDQ